MRPWILITITGTTAATVVSALTYTTAVQTSEVTASTTSFVIKKLGYLGSAIASYFMGDTAAISVRVVSDIAGDMAQRTISNNGKNGAILLSVSTGLLTALTITTGKYVVQYSIEYGGIFSSYAAKLIAEKYLTWKYGQLPSIHTDNIKVICDDDWALIDFQPNSDGSDIIGVIEDKCIDPNVLSPVIVQ